MILNNKGNELDVYSCAYNYINNTHWKMKIPKDSSELHDWGIAFHNCVSGYSDKIQNRRCNIISFWDNNKPVLCVEVEPDTKNIRQAFEPCNKYPNENIKNEFVNGFVNINNLTYGMIMPDVFA